MAFDKPIVIIYEEEERFFSFDLHRWQNNLCVKAPLPPPDKDGAYDATVTDKEKKQGFRWARAIPPPSPDLEFKCIVCEPVPYKCQIPRV